MRKLNKKAMILYYIVIPGFIAGLVTFYIASLEAQDPSQTFIGEKELGFIIGSQKANNYQIYLEQAAKLALGTSIYNIADKGGYAIASSCSNYEGYQLWTNTNNRECYPDYKNNITADFDNNLKLYLNNLKDLKETTTIGKTQFSFIFKEDNITYTYLLENNRIIGTGNKNIRINTTMGGLKIGDYSFRPSFNTEIDYSLEEFEQIITQARTLVSDCSVQELESCINTNLPENWKLGPCEGEIIIDNRQAQFCVVSSEKIPTATGYQPITHKFALHFPEPEEDLVDLLDIESTTTIV